MNDEFSAADLDDLQRAKAHLDNPGLAVKLTALIGRPFEKLLSYAPQAANDVLLDATQAALDKCLSVALKTIKRDTSAERPWNRLHKLAVATTGAAGGAFGLLALPIELPLTTTLMFRSICDIARSEGEDLADLEVRLQCLVVLAMGGPSKADDEASFGYFVVRGALAQSVSKASAEIAAKGVGQHGSTMLGKLIHAIAVRFSTQVSEQVAAKSVPAIGAVFGAAVNTVFMDHFQDIAHGHFTVRRLERKYGEEAVRQKYLTL